MKNSSGGRRGGDRAKTAPSLNFYGDFSGQQLTAAATAASAAANIGDCRKKQQQQPELELDVSATCMESGANFTSGDTSSQLSSFAASGTSFQHMPVLPPSASLSSAGGVGGGTKQAPRPRAKRPDSPRVITQAAGGGSSETSSGSSDGGSSSRSSNSSSSRSSNSSSSRSSNSSSSFGCESGSLSFPESEIHWSDLRALKPLINPNRLQALRLCTRDQEHISIHDGGDATIVARPTSPNGRSRRQQQQHQHRLETGTSQSQQTLTRSYQASMDSLEISQAVLSASTAVAAAAATAAAATAAAATAAAATAATASEPMHCVSSYGGRSEIRMATSGNDLSSVRRAVYQFSFRIPDTKANMRAFSSTGDRRVEAIARACDSEVSVDPEPTLVAGSSLRLRRVTIRAPDPHSLEKCCRMFDHKFPHFYVSGGLGPGGRCISKVYDDGDERYISMSPDQCS